ncbi:MAG: KaiC domain-containing protein [Candidatus Nitrosothermus koennekii]|nr:MAG: KaiC domain-containing protein [Candidatus Nitrosothermus koennekii]
MERILTGIPGFDDILHGGLPKRNVVLLSGGPGTGKSIFGYQYIYNGLANGESGVIVALEEHPVQVRVSMEQFGWNVSKYEKNGKFALVDAFTAGIGEAAKREKYVVKAPDDFNAMIDVIKDAIKDVNANRVVIDSVTTLYITKPMLARNMVLQLKKVLSGLGCTSFLISQVSVTERGFGGPGVEHAADGIVRLDLDEVEGELLRSIIVWKMRGTSHSMKRHPFDITNEGIVIKPEKVISIKRGVVEVE